MFRQTYKYRIANYLEREVMEASDAIEENDSVDFNTSTLIELLFIMQEEINELEERIDRLQ